MSEFDSELDCSPSMLIAESDSSNDRIRKSYQHQNCSPSVLFPYHLELSELKFCSESYDQNTKRCPI